MKKLLIGALLATGLSAATLGQPRREDPRPAASPQQILPPDLAAPRFGRWGFDLEGRDPSVKPGDDFFRYANGRYLDALQIPLDRSNWGPYSQLGDVNDRRIRALVEGSAADPRQDSDAALIGTLYSSFLDEKRVEALGASPLLPRLRAIRAADTLEKQAALMGRSLAGFGGSFFEYGFYEDRANPQINAVYINHGGLGLPDRSYYLQDGYAEVRTKYQAYVADQLKRVGWPEAEASAGAILALETRLAGAHWPAEARRDILKLYSPMRQADLARLAPGFPWRAFLRASGLADVQVVAAQKSAFPEMGAIFAQTPVKTLQAWQAFHTVDEAAPFLAKAFADAAFDFKERSVSGRQEQRPRWRRGVALVNELLGEAIGRKYVGEYFPAASKAMMETMVGHLRTAMRERLEKLDWMAPSTRREALDKLARMRVKIGYPEKWRDYRGLRLAAADLLGNVERARAFEWNRQVRRVGKAADPGEWKTTPQSVNAYYSPAGNEIVFAAGILQPPLFDPLADSAVNYGAIGAVIGHEIAHGFDDQGRKSDSRGVLRDWWTAEDAARFEAEATKLKAQYDAFEGLPGAKVNGNLTLGENIADLLGVLLALDAYQLSLGGRAAPVLYGLSGDQRVMLGWAQGWRRKTREAAMRRLLATDTHAPPEFRTIGPLRNIDRWYSAFGVKEGDRYYLAPAERVRIW